MTAAKCQRKSILEEGERIVTLMVLQPSAVSIAPEANKLLADNDYQPLWQIADKLFYLYE